MCRNPDAWHWADNGKLLSSAQGTAPIVLWRDGAPKADSLGSGAACYLVTGGARHRAAARCSLLQQDAQMAGRGCFGYRGHGLVLGCAYRSRNPFAAIEQAVKHSSVPLYLASRMR